MFINLIPFNKIVPKFAKLLFFNEQFKCQRTFYTSSNPTQNRMLFVVSSDYNYGDNGQHSLLKLI